MAEFIERGKALAMRFTDGIDEDGVIYVPWRDVVQHIKTLPAADVVEVVRCKDCRFYDANTHMCGLYGINHWEGFYCHDGGRRDKND